MFKLAPVLLALVATSATAQQLPPAQVAAIDQLVAKTLGDTGVPSSEIAVVRGGTLVLNKAYGKANEGLAADPKLPYQIASNSKQFTAMALLLLEDEGKLKLDDHDRFRFVFSCRSRAESSPHSPRGQGRFRHLAKEPAT